MRAVLWRASGNGAQTALQLAVFLLLARLLEPHALGVAAAALSVIKFADLFWQLGLGEALTQRPQITPQHQATVFSASGGTGLLLAGLLWLLAPQLAAWYGWPELQPVLRAVAWLLPLNGLGVASDALLRRALKFKDLALIELCANVLGTGLTGLLLAWHGYGVYALVGAALVQAATKNFLLLWYAPPTAWGATRAAWHDLAHFGGGLTLNRICNYFALQGDNLIVGYGLGAEALGLYTRAYSLMNNGVALCAKALDDVLFAALAQLQDTRTRQQNTYRQSVQALALVVLPVSTMLAILAPEIIHLLLGPQWSGAVVPFQIFAAGLVLRSGHKISGAAARANGAVYGLAWRQAVYGGLVLLGAMFGLRGGVNGVAACVTLAMLVHYALLGQLSVKVLGLRGRDFALWHAPALVPTLLAGVTTWTLATVVRGALWPDWAVIAMAGSLATLVSLPLCAFYGKKAGQTALAAA